MDDKAAVQEPGSHFSPTPISPSSVHVHLIQKISSPNAALIALNSQTFSPDFLLFLLFLSISLGKRKKVPKVVAKKEKAKHSVIKRKLSPSFSRDSIVRDEKLGGLHMQMSIRRT